jgi:adenylylsulfate kinase
MKESHLRSLTKAISWRIFGTVATMIIAYLFTHKISLTIYIGLFEFFSKIALFYLHERIWNAVSFGLAKMHPQKSAGT